MVSITLFNGETCLVDDEDVALVTGFRWRANYSKDGRVSGVVAGKHPAIFVMHRLIMGFAVTGLIDHKDGNPLNNQRANLRVATHTENMRNRRKAVSNKCGLKGVYLDKKHGTYRAEIKVDRRKIRLGSFATPELAHAAYIAAAKKHHGEFARFA